MKNNFIMIFDDDEAQDKARGLVRKVMELSKAGLDDRDNYFLTLPRGDHGSVTVYSRSLKEELDAEDVKYRLVGLDELEREMDAEDYDFLRTFIGADRYH